MNTRPSLLETGAGNVVTQAALTLVGAVTGNPWAALLPPLAQSLASGRQQKRVEETLRAVEAEMQARHEHIKQITDAQYKMVNEAVLALLQTTDVAKMDYLRKAISHSLDAADILPHEAIILSRLLRDLSAEEASFLVENFSAKYVTITKQPSGRSGDTVLINHCSHESLIFTGLIALGLLITPLTKFWDDEQTTLEFAPITAKLIALLKGTSAA